MGTSPFDHPVLRYLSRFRIQARFALVLTTAVWSTACNSIAPPPPTPYTEQLIMPNGSAWMSVEAPLGFQGAWYWFDDGLGSNVETVEAVLDLSEETSDAGHSTPPDRVYWYDQSNTDNLDFNWNNNTVKEICVDGSVLEYIAVGFEVCSGQSDEAPYEFPSVLGNCNRANSQDIVRRFRGIAFDLDLTPSQFDRIEVEFKEWKTDDPTQADQARCVVYGKSATRGDGLPECESSVPESDPTKLRIHAYARTATSIGGSSLNLSMLQAIHVIVFKNNTSNKGNLRYCLSRVYAFGYDEVPEEVDTEDFGQVTTVDLDCSATVSKAPTDTEPPDFPSDFWVEAPIAETDKDAPFDIMRAEATVGQYRDCIEAGLCSPIILPWESCNAGDAGFIEDDAEWPNRAVNCVTWCQANDFCNWVEGTLPSVADWERIRPPSNADYCNDIVMNDPGRGGAGCGDRMPAPVCSKISTGDNSTLCDMYGNLWEWTADEAKSVDSPPSPGYKRLFGGSLNTITKDMFGTSKLAIEHPVIPHSPTRLGFRCIRNHQYRK